MKVVNKVELKLEGFEKCHVICDIDCGVGTLHDYAYALRAFCVNKIKEAEKAEKPVEINAEAPAPQEI